jgi:hypothetical protein
MHAMVAQKPVYVPIESARFSKFLCGNPDAFNGIGAGARRWTYSHGLIDGCVAVAMGVFVVRKSALLAGERGSALVGSSHCCSAE